MSVVDSLAVAAAERLERAMGPGAALASYRAIERRAAPGEARARALLGMLRCALATGDDLALREAIGAWARAGGGDHLGATIETSKALSRSGRTHLAAELATAEVARHPTARALYLRGRTLEILGEAQAARDALASAATRAAREGAEDIAAAARARLAEIAAREGTHSEAAPIEDPRRALSVHAARLAAAPSRFARASALSSLVELAEAAIARGDRATAEAAVLAAARHADDRGDALTPIEKDRVAAALALWPLPEEAVAATARLQSTEGKEALVDALARRGWTLATRGDRAGALLALSEAKALAGRGR